MTLDDRELENNLFFSSRRQYLVNSTHRSRAIIFSLARLSCYSVQESKKSKVDNLYRGSKRSDRCRTATTILPLFIGPMPWLPHTAALTWKPSQRKVPNYTAWWAESRDTLVWTTCPRSWASCLLARCIGCRLQRV